MYSQYLNDRDFVQMESESARPAPEPPRGDSSPGSTAPKQPHGDLLQDVTGGISQLLGDLLLEMGYTGSYQRIAPKQFIPQASIAAQLDEIGLSEAAMLKKIRQTVEQKEKEQSV